MKAYFYAALVLAGILMLATWNQKAALGLTVLVFMGLLANKGPQIRLLLKEV